MIRLKRRTSRWAKVIVTATTVAVTAATMSGCSSGSSGTPTEGTTTGSAGTARVVTDAMSRTVRVPADPSRVVTLSEPTLDGALALGVHVVGTTSGRGQSGVSAYLAAKAQGIPIVASVSGPELEKIADLHPDLILLDGTVSSSDAIIGKLDDIAPTAFVSKTGQDWKSAFRAEAAILGMKASAAKVLGAYRSRIAKIKKTLGANAHATVSIVRWGSGVPSMMLKEIASSTVVADLGLRRPPSQNKRGPGHSTPVSLELLDKLDADWMFFGTLGGATSPSGGNNGTAAGVAASRAMLKQAVKTPGFSRLHAYRAHHIVPVDGSAWTSAGGPLAENVVLSQIAGALGSR